MESVKIDSHVSQQQSNRCECQGPMHERAGDCMNGQQVNTFDLGGVSPIKYFFAVAVVLGVLFALISQDEQPSRSLLGVFLQWQLQTALPITLLIVCHMLLSHYHFFERRGPWLQLLISGLLGVLLFTPLAWYLDQVFAVDGAEQPLGCAQLLDEFLGVGPPVVLSWLAMNAPWVLGYRINPSDEAKQRNESAVEQPVPSRAAAAFYQLLPPAIGTEVVYLKAELHYIEVNTLGGQALILYNLKDAIQDLQHLTGLQTHRSYWVNCEYIENFQKKGRQGELTLSNGDRVPVSRTRMPVVGEACQQINKALN